MPPDNRNSQPRPPSEPPGSRVTRTEQPIWKVAIIKILQGTIGVLETAVEKLETEPPPRTRETPSFLQRLDSTLSRFLRTVRLFLPSNVSNNLSDITLTGIIIAGIAVVLIWITWAVLHRQPAQVATVPTPTPIVVPTPQPSEEITLPTTPAPSPEPTAISSPELEPIPNIELTPEQALIAEIENQVAEISDRFFPDLIKSIQANFRTSKLTIKITANWYSLSKSQQDELASVILQRSKELDFTHLEIIDSQDRLIARNPVIGSEMVFFHHN